MKIEIRWKMIKQNEKEIVDRLRRSWFVWMYWCAFQLNLNENCMVFKYQSSKHRCPKSVLLLLLIAIEMCKIHTHIIPRLTHTQPCTLDDDIKLKIKEIARLYFHLLLASVHFLTLSKCLNGVCVCMCLCLCFEDICVCLVGQFHSFFAYSTFVW